MNQLFLELFIIPLCWGFSMTIGLIIAVHVFWFVDIKLRKDL